MQKVICLSGQIESGKDAAGKYLVKRLRNIEPYRKLYPLWKRVAFGDEVKRVLSENYGVSLDFIEEWKRVDETPPGFDMTIRRALMWIGDGFRQIRASIWIDKLFEKHSPVDAHLVISDGRYLSELQAATDREGINVAIHRPSHGNDIDHPSEAQLKPYIDALAERYHKSRPVSDPDSPFDYFLLNASSLDDLYDTIEDSLIPFIKERFDD